LEYRSSKPLRANERALIDLILSLDTRYPNTLIVVEGKRDVRILRNLGIKSRIVKTQTKMTRDELIDSIAQEVGETGEVLILTDFDSEGTELAKYLQTSLELHKVKIMEGLRIRIRNLMGNWRCIEEMVALFKREDSPAPSG
jgi:5S rRNA maturation endonuclease (ribonuclease M5)